MSSDNNNNNILRVRIEGCGCRYRKYPNTNYNNDILEECDYLCPEHMNEFIVKLYNAQYRLKQLKGKFGKILEF